MTKKQTVKKKSSASSAVRKKVTTPAKRIHERVVETDGAYFLKLVAVFLLGTFWIKFSEPILLGEFRLAAIPLGVFAGFLLVRMFEKYQSDRKIWYALLVIVGVMSNFQAAGIVI